MANLLKTIGEALGSVNAGYNKVFSSNDTVTSIETGYGNKLWRAAILLHRVTHKQPLPGESSNVVTSNKKLGDTNTFEGKVLPKYESKRSELNRKDAQRKSPTVSVVEISQLPSIQWVKKENQVIIYNISISPAQYIVLQNRPTSIDFRGDTSWASIKSMGRNTPLYHYTGAEDTVQFNISWYCDDPQHPDEVINKCRLLESWSKADGYSKSPPVLRIQFGNDQNDHLFKDQFFILKSATYTLKNFNSLYTTDGRRVDSNKNVTYRNGKLYPMVATQELVFNRVSDHNITYKDIIPVERLNYTRGIVLK